MDTLRVKRRWPKPILWGSAVVSVLAAVLVGGTAMLNDRGIDAETVFVAEVQGGQFDIVVVADGVIRPRVEEVVTALVEGRVKEVLIEPGEVVEAGTPLVMLENDDIKDAYVHAVWEANVTAADAAAEKIAAENTIQDIKASLARTRLELEKKDLFISAQESLPELSIPKVDYEVRKLEASNLLSVLDMETARLERYQILAASLADAREAKRLKGENLLEAAKKKRDSLVIRSPAAGTASISADVAVGRRVAKGESVARVVGTSGYFAELEVPEHWAGRVAVSAPAIIETWQGEIVGKVAAIDADVDEGRVMVKVDLGEPDDALLPGIAVEGRIVTASVRDAVYVRKPVHARERGSQQIYRYDAESLSYVLSDVEFGRASATEIQVLAGLAPGDRIIVSDVMQVAAGSNAVKLR